MKSKKKHEETSIVYCEYCGFRFNLNLKHISSGVKFEVVCPNCHETTVGKK